MPSIIKSIRLPQDRMMERFVEKQSNFSTAIRYLVTKYCREVGYDGIQDLTALYKEFTELKMYGDTYGDKLDAPIRKEPPVAVHNTVEAAIPRTSDKGKIITENNSVNKSSADSSAEDDVPSCYQ